MKFALSFCLVVGFTLELQAQLITGVLDRTVYTDSVTFNIPSAPGFTYEVSLNGQPVPAGAPRVVSVMDYYDLVARRTQLSDASVTTQTVRFIVVSSRRGSPEVGLIEWTPHPPIPSGREEFAGGNLFVVAPQNYPAGLEIPIIAWVDDGPGNARRVNGNITAQAFPNNPLPLRRGVGHTFLPRANAGATIGYAARIHSLTAPKSIQVDATAAWQTVSGTLPPGAEWAANSRIHATGHLTIAAGNTLTIGAGAIVLLDPLVNITNSGRTVINGTLDNPVVFTAQNRVAPEQHAGAWGGFLLRGASAELVAHGAIMTGAGGAASFSFSPGASHRSEQALLLVQSGARAFLTNCFLINNAGQIGNGFNSDITYDHCLLQRAVTGGEYEGGTIIVNNSAIIEFPSIDGVYNSAIADADYDAIYFTTGTHSLRDSLVGFAKDDAIDSGSGGAGTVVVTNCWVESALHEALAWSGGGRQTWSYDSVLINCGQGIECGWSTGANSPLCHGERLLSIANSIGARYGDNYQGAGGLGLKTGFLTVTNSMLLHNHRDVFGRAWDGTWNYRAADMDIRGNLLTAPNTNHPGNAVWNPTTQAGRLLPHMRTPPGAAVGIGFANWSALTPSALSNGIPVRLSTFTTNDVQVNYVVETPAATLASGTLQFQPGETVKSIFAPAPNLPAGQIIRVLLRDPLGAEITTAAQQLILPAAANPGTLTLVPMNASWKYLDDGSNQGAAWNAANFNDAAWPVGTAQFGFGDQDESTPLRRLSSSGATNLTFYFRKSFPVANPSAFASLKLRLLRDDAGVVYLNDAEIYRSPNLPAPPAVIDFTTRALSTGENTIDTATVSATGLRAGDNTIAVEIHQESAGSSDVSFDLECLAAPATAGVRLGLARFGPEHLLHWSDDASHLETTEALTPPAVWKSAEIATSPFPIPMSGEARYYRLSK